MNDRFKNILIASFALIILGLLLIFVVAPETTYESQISSIGLSLITAGIVAISLDKISLTAISEELNGVMSKGLEEISVRNYGVSNIEDYTSYTDIHEAIATSSEFTLVQTWSPDMKTILRHAEKMILNGGTMKVFLLHPSCASAFQRSMDLEEDINYVSEKIRSDTNQVRSLYRRLAKNYDISEEILSSSIRLFYYSSLPAFALYRTDKMLWVAFYWQKLQSDSAMTLKIDCSISSNALDHYEDQITGIEENAVSVNLRESLEIQLPDNDASLHLDADT